MVQALYKHPCMLTFLNVELLTLSYASNHSAVTMRLAEYGIGLVSRFVRRTTREYGFHSC